MKDLQDAGRHTLLGHLAALNELSRFTLDAFEEHSDAIGKFLLHDVLVAPPTQKDASMMPNAARHAPFAQTYDDDKARWKEYHVRFFKYEHHMHLSLSIRKKQFEFDEDNYDKAHKVQPHSLLNASLDGNTNMAPLAGRSIWKWRGKAGDEDADRLLKIRSFPAWSSTKPLALVAILWFRAGVTLFFPPFFDNFVARCSDNLD